jgi:hypothetical protein
MFTLSMFEVVLDSRAFIFKKNFWKKFHFQVQKVCFDIFLKYQKLKKYFLRFLLNRPIFTLHGFLYIKNIF